MSESAPRNEFAPSGFFALRTPLLSFAAQPVSRAELRALILRPEVRDALFIAAPSLEARLDVWQRDPDSDAGRKIEKSLARYAARMAGRATPFGLFAGCSVGVIGRATCLAVGAPCKRHTRLDMDYVVGLVGALSRDPDLQPSLRFTPNTSLVHVAGRARYLEVRRQDKGWSHHRAALDVPDYLNAVLNCASGGATPPELIRALLDHDPEATEAEAAEYVAELIEQQILVSELVPAVTGPEPIHALIERLSQLPAGGAAAERLACVRDELAALDAHGPGVAPDRYRVIASRLRELPAAVDESRLFQVDMVRPAAGATLGENVVAEMARGVELLRRLMARPDGDPLTVFRQAFTARFGDTPITREVPLAEALDDETGVGFGGATVEASSLLEGLDLSPPADRHRDRGARETYLLGRLTETLARGEQELTLTDRDVEQLSEDLDPLPLPDAFAVMARLEAASGEAVARGDFRLLLMSVTGPSGARLLGRFCHADPELAAGVARHLRAEEALRPDAVFAEIVHLPEGRLGNILARPADRAYEIPYLGRSEAPADQQIPLSDLRVSVDGSRVILRSARLGREVVPRLTSAHNFAASQGLYAFLCALQGQGVASGLGWDWGPLAASAFLPRVVRGRLVLERARWRVTPAEAAGLQAGSKEDRFALVQRWRQTRRLPRWVCLTEFDNELPIDLDNPLMVETLLGQMKGREHVTLTELFPAPDRLCAVGPDGPHVHELVVPFVKCVAEGGGGEGLKVEIGSSLPQRLLSAAPCPRVFPPGSEWLTVKLYAGSMTVDHLVRDVVGPLAVEMVAAGLARRWFFVRYADPHGHLRLRFEGDPERLTAEVLPRVQTAVAPLLADGRVWKVQLDTYEREIERYGGPTGMELCEQLFHHDSEAVVELLRRFEDDSRGDLRWRLALLGMDRLLDDLGLELEGKRAVLRRARDATRAEFRMNGEASRRLGAKYRAEVAALAGLLGSEPGPGSAWADARAVLDRHSRNNAPATALLRHAEQGRLTVSVAEVAVSLLHMHANRLLRSAHRAQEMVLYDFLYRCYETGNARRSEDARTGVETSDLGTVLDGDVELGLIHQAAARRK
jgi:thiopeptide-type bacteriocin biosynthesis protein